MKNIKLWFIVFSVFIFSMIVSDFDYAKQKVNWSKKGFSGLEEKGMKQGEWKNYYLNGQLAEVCNYLNDTLNGIRVGYTPDGQNYFSETYKKGIKVDTFKRYSDGGLNYIGFRDSLGKQQGEFKVFVDDRLSQLGHYLDDKLHGKFNSYDYKTGKMTQIYQYRNGEKSGDWIYLDEKGDTIRIEKYD